MDLPGFGQMLRRVWKPITASIVIGAYLYFTSRRQNFDIAVTVKGADGKRKKQMKTLPLSVKEVEARLSEHMASNTESLPGGLVWKHTTVFLPSNNPIEDADCYQLIQRDDATGDYLFFGNGRPFGHRHLTLRDCSKTIIIKATALQLTAQFRHVRPSLSMLSLIISSLNQVIMVGNRRTMRKPLSPFRTPPSTLCHHHPSCNTS